ncbi:uncharacterized protein TM35_000012050 [Trypanosoma theileri]|uniref:GPR1/FUN34/yaaH family protein n=1 Tax=Trypanosoma theileri TaxID=67003 RepID=A0A1X0P8X4_9TRYP|nr:uncharacterized protein TM35_000012050 [Trypanosoma theileri]ORC93328.1 hypothetical protein TM35_000012050 [Trypanosoma theileri]
MTGNFVHNEPQDEKVDIMVPGVVQGGESESKQFIDSLSNGAVDKTVLMQELLRGLLENNEIVLEKKGRKGVNPAPLGLIGFGMTTVLLNLHNASLFELGSVVPAMGLSIGGPLQILVGLLEYFNGNAFGATAFMSYGAFWLSLVALWLLPQGDDHPHVWMTTKPFIGFYLLLWGLYTLCMTVVTFLKLNRMMQTLFTTLTVLYFLLAAGNFAENATVLKVAGWEGIFCGLVALYIAFAEILQDNLGYPVLPLFHVKRD